MSLTLPIVIGKRYVRRDGALCTAAACTNPAVAFSRVDADRTSNDSVYIATGRFYTGRPSSHPADLVADHIDSGAHPHAARMVLYAQDAAETSAPWLRWENRNKCAGSEDWSANTNHPEWNPALEYRRKPRIIRIGEFDVPEPLRQPLERGADYWVVQIIDGQAGVLECSNFNPSAGLRHLASGLVHLTREAAEQHARALLSLTQQTGAAL